MLEKKDIGVKLMFSLLRCARKNNFENVQHRSCLSDKIRLSKVFEPEEFDIFSIPAIICFPYAATCPEHKYFKGGLHISEFYIPRILYYF